MSVPVRVFTGKRLTLNPNVEDILVNFEIAEIPVGPGATYDDLLRKCAIYCHIMPMYHLLFAIWHPDKNSWMKLSDSINASNSVQHNGNATFESDSCLEFRVRFLVKSEMQVDGQKRVVRRWSAPGEGVTNFIDETVTNYLYRQKREDFLTDKLKLSNEDTTEDVTFTIALGIAALDVLCLSKMFEQSVKKTRKKVHLRDLLSKEYYKIMQSYSTFNRVRVRTKFKHFLRYLSPTAENWQQKGHPLDYFQQRYLLNLELSSSEHGVERYDLAKSGFITVGADSGITLHSDEGKENAEKWCTFGELTDMTLQVRHPCEDSDSGMPESQSPGLADPGIADLGTNLSVVRLGKFDGSVKKFAMKSVRNAENLASCIDGFYHLLVDAHHYLCREVCSPNFIDHLRLGCHGPITCTFAEEILQDRISKGIARIGDSVIRQSRENYGEYFVNNIWSVSPFEIRNYKLDRGPNNQLGLYGWVQSHSHENLERLLQACAGGKYKDQQIPFNPSKRIPPRPKHKSNLIVRLCSELDNERGIEDIVPKTVLIELSDYTEVFLLGIGMFTSVNRYAYARNEDTRRYVVFKSILDQGEAQQDHHINRSFQESTSLLNRLSHHHIVEHIGMTLNNMVALEYLHHHSITSYLARPPNRAAIERQSWFLQVLWQITHACHYLEELGYAHGNLCGKNILLQNDYPQPLIKLADPGVRTRIVRDTSGLASNIAPILPAPWLAHEFCYVDAPPTSNRYPTLDGDKWSFATTVCEILNWGTLSVSPMNFLQMTQEMKEFYRQGDLNGCLHLPKWVTDNEELFNLIAMCWSTIPDMRPPFQQILREFGSTLTEDYVSLSMNSEQVIDVVLEIEHGLPTYEDEKLTRIRSLGEGHFGTVDLFAYDRNRNGQTEKVAVKASKRATNRQQQDFMQEIETMKRLNHPYVVRLLGIAEPSGRIVMEFLKNGSLADDLRQRRQNNNKMPPSLLLRFSAQIAEGMVALQERRLIHRDLALRNILLGNDSTNRHIKISDFGLSRFLSEEKNIYVGRLEEFPAHWYAPECLCEEPMRAFGFKSDVWSFGVTIWEMFSHADRPTYPPLLPITQTKMLPSLKNHLVKGNRLPRTPYCPVRVYEIMLRCWVIDPDKRISFGEIRTKIDNLMPFADRLEF